MKWLDGPPPEGSFGLYLVQLDAVAVRKRFAIGLGFDGDPVAVRWCGDKGKDTLRQTRIDADLVTKHATIWEAK